MAIWDRHRCADTCGSSSLPLRRRKLCTNCMKQYRRRIFYGRGVPEAQNGFLYWKKRDTAHSLLHRCLHSLTSYIFRGLYSCSMLLFASFFFFEEISQSAPRGVSNIAIYKSFIRAGSVERSFGSVITHERGRGIVEPTLCFPHRCSGSLKCTSARAVQCVFRFLRRLCLGAYDYELV